MLERFKTLLAEEEINNLNIFRTFDRDPLNTEQQDQCVRVEVGGGEHGRPPEVYDRSQAGRDSKSIKTKNTGGVINHFARKIRVIYLCNFLPKPITFPV